MEPIRIAELEAAINRARAAEPALGIESTLSVDVSALAGIYGQMIYWRVDSWPLGDLSDRERQALQRWIVR